MSPPARRPIAVLPNGGSISATTGNTLAVDGVISGAGVLSVGYGPIATNEANNTTGTITQNLPSSPNTAGNGIVILSGSNTAFTGGINVNAGTLRVDTASAGTATYHCQRSGDIGWQCDLDEQRPGKIRWPIYSGRSHCTRSGRRNTGTGLP